MSVTAAQGFRAAGVRAGLKASGKPDLALVINDGPLDTAAGVFTTNRVVAAPVVWSRRLLAGPEGGQPGRARAVGTAYEALADGMIDLTVARRVELTKPDAEALAGDLGRVGGVREVEVAVGLVSGRRIGRLARRQRRHTGRRAAPRNRARKRVRC